MKRFLCLTLILVACSFAACKKSEEPSEPAKAQPQNGEMKASEAAKKNKPKKGPGPAALQIFQEEKLVATIPPNEYAGITTTSVKVEGQEYKAILLTELLKKYNVTGKTVTLKGPAKQSSLTWEQVTANPIYVYIIKKRLQVFNETKDLEAANLPTVLVKITAAEKPAPAAPAEAKGAKKRST